VVARLQGIFEPRVSSDLEDLNHWVARYLELIEALQQDEDRTLIPKLFYHGMVLSDNARMMRHLNNIDLVEIRRNMKGWHRVLFAKYMRHLEGAG